jgi:hypothetical protein
MQRAEDGAWQEEVKNGKMEIERLKSDLHLSEVRHADELDELRRGMEARHADRMQEVLDENSAKMQEQLTRNAKSPPGSLRAAQEARR